VFEAFPEGLRDTPSDAPFQWRAESSFTTGAAPSELLYLDCRPATWEARDKIRPIRTRHYIRQRESGGG